MCSGTHSLLPLCSRISPEFASVINLWVSRAIDHYRGCFSLWSNLKVFFCYIFYQVCCDDRSSVSKYQFSWIEGKNELLEHYCWSEYNTSDAASIYFQIQYVILMPYIMFVLKSKAGQEYYENLCMKAVNQSIGKYFMEWFHSVSQPL